MAGGDVAALVRSTSRNVVVPIEFVSFLVLPVLFIIAVKYNVYTRFPASLFRWIMTVDWMMTVWRLIQWTPFLPSSQYLGVVGSGASLAGCRAVAFIDTTLLFVNLANTAGVVGSIFWMVCLERRFTTLQRAALPGIFRMTVWLCSLAIASLVMFDSHIPTSLGYCIGGDRTVLVKVSIAYVLLGVQALLFIPSLGTILITAARTRTRLSAGSYQYMFFCFAEVLTVMPVLTLEFSTTSHEARTPGLIWFALLSGPLCHLLKSAIFARHLWAQWQILEVNKQGKTGGASIPAGGGLSVDERADRRRTMAGRGSKVAQTPVPETPRTIQLRRVDTGEAPREYSMSYRGVLPSSSPKLTGYTGFLSHAPPLTDTAAWNDRRNTMLGGGTLEDLAKRWRTPVLQGMSPAKNGGVIGANASFPPPLALPSTAEQIGSDASATPSSATLHASIAARQDPFTPTHRHDGSFIRPQALHLGVSIPHAADNYSTPSHGRLVPASNSDASAKGDLPNASPITGGRDDLVLLSPMSPMIPVQLERNISSPNTPVDMRRQNSSGFTPTPIDAPLAMHRQPSSSRSSGESIGSDTPQATPTPSLRRQLTKEDFKQVQKQLQMSKRGSGGAPAQSSQVDRITPENRHLAVVSPVRPPATPSPDLGESSYAAANSAAGMRRSPRGRGSLRASFERSPPQLHHQLSDPSSHIATSLALPRTLSVENGRLSPRHLSSVRGTPSPVLANSRLVNADGRIRRTRGTDGGESGASSSDSSTAQSAHHTPRGGPTTGAFFGSPSLIPQRALQSEDDSNPFRVHDNMRQDGIEMNLLAPQTPLKALGKTLKPSARHST
jgi:hypothetical protein